MGRVDDGQEAKTGWGHSPGLRTQPRAGGWREEALPVSDGDFLCSQGPKRNFWVN